MQLEVNAAPRVGIRLMGRPRDASEAPGQRSDSTGGDDAVAWLDAGNWQGRQQQRLGGPRFAGQAEEVALQKIAAELSQQGKLPMMFDPFRHHIDAQGLRHSDHGSHDDTILRILAEASDERAVDLEHAHRKAFEVAQEE